MGEPENPLVQRYVRGAIAAGLAFLHQRAAVVNDQIAEHEMALAALAAERVQLEREYLKERNRAILKRGSGHG